VIVANVAFDTCEALMSKDWQRVGMNIFMNALASDTVELVGSQLFPRQWKAFCTDYVGFPGLVMTWVCRALLRMTPVFGGPSAVEAVKPVRELYNKRIQNLDDELRRAKSLYGAVVNGTQATAATAYDVCSWSYETVKWCFCY
jgi:hypothetical protein